jgi:hypothetical protein
MLLPSKKNTNNAEKLMRAYLKDVNFYGAIKDIIAVKNMINLRTGASSKATVNNNNNNNNNENESGKLMQINFKKFNSHNTTLNRNFNSTSNNSPNSSPTATIKRAQTIENNTLKLLGHINKHSSDMNKIKYERANKTSVNRKKLGANIGANIGSNIGKASKTYINKTSKFTINSLMH